MKKAFLAFLVLVCIYGFNGHILEAATGKYELITTVAKLTIDQKGNLKVIQNIGSVIQINTSINNLWKIVLKNELNNSEYVFTPVNNYTITNNNSIIRITVNNFSAEGKTLPLKAEFTISVKDDAFCFSGFLKSHSEEWIIKELDYPVFSGIRINDEKAGIYWPNGLGQYYDDPVSFGSRSLTYPSAVGAAMPWFSVKNLNSGLYFGSHDPLQETRIFNLSYIEPAHVLKATVNIPIYENEYSIPDIMVKSYTGEWHIASKFYRSWYDIHFKAAISPDWVINDSGWLLAILKQQNLEVMWTYKDIDKLCDIAYQNNLSTIGLFGWAVGGHDHLYPNYQPDNLLGGRKELKKAIERAHKRGIKIILYANGKIMDTSTDFYKYNGIETIVIKENKRPDIQMYVKQKNSTPVIFAQGCTGSILWRKTMYDLGLQAVSLGADGILFDQVGAVPPVLCFSKNHDHKPGESDANCRLEMIREIRKDMKEINPDFAVMTEATNDAILREIDYTHGWGRGTAPGPTSFPELFRFTFPELIETQRNPNPMITRTDANFAAVYGLRHEIETRYPDDVKFLLDGTLPTSESYLNVVSPPNLNKMNMVPVEVAEKYVHVLIEFEKKNSEFLRHGKFIDGEGIEVNGNGNDILAKGFKNATRIGVVVWNRNTSEKRDFSISVPGYSLTKASEPGKAEVIASSPLDANSIRLIIFEKN